jgi:hypothetical protein
VFVVVEGELGHTIGEGGERRLVAARVPVAMLIMGLGVCLSIAAARIRRTS